MSATILLVESDLIDRADWQALLQFHGYKVHAAPSGKAALDCFPEVQPDLVVMESALADISSDELCRRLRADPRRGDTPIVMVGSYLDRLKLCREHEQITGGSSTNSATRTQTLDRIHKLLAGGQFCLFDESPEELVGGPGSNRLRIEIDSIYFDG
jgi:CheY-like chemotaxis protein